MCGLKKKETRAPEKEHTCVRETMRSKQPWSVR
jgi:hypothetical protein